MLFTKKSTRKAFELGVGGFRAEETSRLRMKEKSMWVVPSGEDSVSDSGDKENEIFCATKVS